MTTRQDLLTHWHQQLTLAEEEERQTASWRQRIRRRLYRFLLTMYRGANWSGSPDDAEDVTTHPAALLVSDEAELPDVADIDGLQSAGKAPRTRAEILHGLKNVRGLSDELAPPGPLQHGLPPDAPVAVAAYKKLPRAERLMSHLIGAGFAPTLAVRSNLYQVFVAAIDAPAAMQLMTRVAAVPPRAPRQEIRTTSSLESSRPALIWAFISGVIGVILTCYVTSVFYQYSANPNLFPAGTPDRFAVLVMATLSVDAFCLFFVWLSWRESTVTERRNGPPEDSPAK